MDGRTHSPAIKEEMVRALRDSGINVLFLGTCPTPVLYFSQHMMPVDAGLMITASHNPSEYNGIKLCLNKESVWGEQLQTIKNLYKQGASSSSTTTGTYTECKGVDIYCDYLIERFPHLKNMSMGVVIDCANAVGGLVMPQLAQKMGWKNITFLYEDLDGSYPNHEADPVVEANMRMVKKTLAENKELAFGIGLDGDCDRMAAMTKSGFLIPGDLLLAIFSKKILKQYPGAAIVFDVKASATLIELLVSWGARPCISACGHSIIKNEMKKEQAVLGGELSCHFCFKDRYFGYDDGIYAALRLFELVLEGETLEELVAMIPQKNSSPEIRFTCAEED
jgi:phosphomannomutase/phosphoglucomutase